MAKSTGFAGGTTIRASETDRALLCPASLVRRRTATKSETATKAAEWGTLVHHWKETGDHSNNKTLLKKLTATKLDREKWWPTADGEGEHEVTFSLNLETLDLRRWSNASKFDRDTWKKRHPPLKYLTGTIDYRTNGPVPHIDDLKTGKWPVSAKKSGQLKSYALMPWVERDCDTEVLASITQWPKYRIADRPKRNKTILLSETLARHLEKLQWAVSNTDVAIPTKEGCMFCEAKPDCKEYKEYERLQEV